MMIHHGGRFTDIPKRKYVDGEVTYVDLIDIKQCKIDILDTIMYQSLGCEGKLFYHYKLPMKSLDTGLRALTSDSDISEMLKFVHKHRVIYVYVEHGTSYLELVVNATEFDTLVGPSNVLGDNTEVEDQDNIEGENNNETENESHDESEDGDHDSTDVEDEDKNVNVEDIVDEEHIVEEVDVKMNGFRFEVEDEAEETMHPKLNLTENDLEVIDFDSFESDVEVDDESERRKGLRKLKKEAAKTYSKNSFFIGKEFANRDLAKEMVRAHAVETRRNIMIVKNDKIRIRAKCFGVVPVGKDIVKKVESVQQVSKGKKVNVQEKGKGIMVNEEEEEKDKVDCPWVVYIGKGDKGKWLVKTFIDEHKCLKSRKIKSCTSTFLSKHLPDLLVMNPNMPVRAIQEQMQRKFHVGVTRTKAFRAKAKAEVHLKGDANLQYSRLRDYLNDLQKCNPNTTVKIDVYGEENPDSPTRMFRRVYVCLGALKDGFRASGRELLGLDGAFMKGQYSGQLLTAVGVDANNGIYPVAYGIVESESKHSWTWFLTCLGDDLDLYNNSHFTFITDRQKVSILITVFFKRKLLKC